MGSRSRRKGADFERQVARDLTERTGIKFRRGIQYREGGKEASDVVSEECRAFHIEAKRGRKPNPRAALEQAMGDAATGQHAVAIIRDDNRDAFVVMPFDDWTDLIAEWWELRNQ